MVGLLFGGWVLCIPKKPLGAFQGRQVLQTKRIPSFRQRRRGVAPGGLQDIAVMDFKTLGATHPSEILISVICAGRTPWGLGEIDHAHESLFYAKSIRISFRIPAQFGFLRAISRRSDHFRHLSES